MLRGAEIIDAYIRTRRLNNHGVYPKFIKREIALKAVKQLDVKCRLINTEDMLFFFAVCFFAKTFRRIDFCAYFYSFYPDENASSGRKQYCFDYFNEALDHTQYCLEKLNILLKDKFDKNILDETKKSLFEFFYKTLKNAPKQEKNILLAKMFSIFIFTLEDNLLESKFIIPVILKKKEGGKKSVTLKYFKYCQYKILSVLSCGRIKKFVGKHKKYKEMLGG